MWEKIKDEAIILTGFAMISLCGYVVTFAPLRHGALHFLHWLGLRGILL